MWMTAFKNLSSILNRDTTKWMSLFLAQMGSIFVMAWSQTLSVNAPVDLNHYSNQINYKIQTMRRVRKFQFKDLTLAFKVREKMWNSLVEFDKNGNQRFQASEIRQALVTILGEDAMQVQYVVNNVFRYDSDGNKQITYAQFTNFSVEQHFGEMAIQRLHKKEYYKNGAKRIMSFDEFEATLNYCLDFIKSNGTRSQYQQLFSQVDLDKDGFISYHDYFVFLREYFGSQSQAYEEEITKPRPIPQKNVPQISSQNAQQKFAKLIYCQFRLLVMDKDANRNLILQTSQVSEILENVLKLKGNDKNELLSRCMSGKNAIKYDDFIRTAIVQYMSQLRVQGNQGQNIGQKQFIDFVMQMCHFVTIKPREQVLRACFKDGSKGGSSLALREYSQVMRNIFQNYKFDTRGLPRQQGFS